MKLTVPIKLLTDELQHRALCNTIVEANNACNYIAGIAWAHKCFSQVPLHKLCYKEVRNKFELHSQIVVRCIAKVVACYARNKKVKPQFRSLGSIAFDARNLTIRTEKSYITIATQLGRIKIPFTAGTSQFDKLTDKVGECILVLRKNTWYLHCSVDVPEDTQLQPIGYIGVDLGIKNIAVTSEGTQYSGSHINRVRHRHRKLRTKLQKKGTKSAKRLLKKRAKRERRFATDVNHCIAKRIVARAKCTKSGIALENLKGITRRTKVKKPQRATHTSWAFYQLQTFIKYKALLYGVPVVMVAPARTSTTCPKCGYYYRYNRKGSKFLCKQCGYAGHADYVAAVNIAAKAVLPAAVAVNQPNVSAA